MSTTTTVEEAEVTPAVRTAAVVWLVTLLAVFALMIVAGITMRLAQGAQITLSPQMFYAVMTMHGLGMAGSLFSAGLVIVWYITSTSCKPSMRVIWISYVLFVIGAVMLLAATIYGGFGAGWYALYPLPFVNPTWPSWSTGTTIAGLMIMGIAWLLLQLDVLRAMVSRFGASRILAWDYFGGKTPSEPLPPQILIASMCVIAGTLGTLSGAATFMMYFFKWQVPTAQFDALLLKNTMFMFGHTIVNVAMYCGVGAIYYFLPKYTGRPWKVNRITAIAWNATLFFVLTAYFHHLYMDFAQPEGLHVFGQIASYGSSVPATAVTMFGVGSQIYRSGIRWKFTPIAFVAGVVGWGIGGIAAIADSTIAVNSHFHNTLWVPAHFHTYFLVGYVLMLLGFIHQIFGSRSERTAGVGLIGMLSGGYGFLLMFYLGGMEGVPRRFASYGMLLSGGINETGAKLATYAAGFATVFLVGALTFCFSLILGRARSAAPQDPEPQSAAE